MGKVSNIDYVDATCNFWHGCHKISEGCENCYMYREKKRYGQDPNIVIRSSAKTFNSPLKWKEPRRILVCSWSDFWIEEADKWRMDAFDIMFRAPQHKYLILTKRPDNMIDWLNRNAQCTKLENIWWGITAENQKRLDERWPYFANLPGLKFISIEPMLGDVDFYPIYNYCGPPGWVIFGAESGPNKRFCNIELIRNGVRQCKDFNIPVFVKQIHLNGKLSKNMDEWPEDLRIREFPTE